MQVHHSFSSQNIVSIASKLICIFCVCNPQVSAFESLMVRNYNLKIFALGVVYLQNVIYVYIISVCHNYTEMMIVHRIDVCNFIMLKMVLVNFTTSTIILPQIILIVQFFYHYFYTLEAKILLVHRNEVYTETKLFCFIAQAKA